MLLSHLCPDILALICPYLDGHQVLRLFLSGTPLLQCKIAEITKELSLECLPFQKMPWLAFQLPKLTSLYLKMTQGYDSYPLRLFIGDEMARDGLQRPHFASSNASLQSGHYPFESSSSTKLGRFDPVRSPSETSGHATIMNLDAPYPCPLQLQQHVPWHVGSISSLTTLKMAFAQSFEILLPSFSSPPLGILLPNLQTLSLTHSTQLLAVEHLRNVPSTLTELVLRREPLEHFAHWLSLPHDHFTALLPPQLESLDINYISIEPNSYSGCYEGIRWPVSLKNIQISRFAAWSILLFKPSLSFPPNAEIINFDVAPPCEDYNKSVEMQHFSHCPCPSSHLVRQCRSHEGIHGPAATNTGERGGRRQNTARLPVVSFDLSISSLPSSTRQFSLRGISPRYVKLVLDGRAPPQLSRIEYPLTVRSECDLAKYLPPSVLHISALQGIVMSARMMQYFPNVEQVPFSCSFDDDICLNLPKKLTIFRWSDHHSVSPLEGGEMPPTLTLMECPLPSSLPSGFIPPSVTELISVSETDAPLPDHFWTECPKFLSKLQLSFSHISAPECLQLLPHSLESLSLYANDQMIDWMKRPDWTQLIPNTISVLELSVDFPHLPIFSWISHLHHLPLISLTVITDSFPTEEPKLEVMDITEVSAPILSSKEASNHDVNDFQSHGAEENAMCISSTSFQQNTVFHPPNDGNVRQTCCNASGRCCASSSTQERKAHLGYCLVSEPSSNSPSSPFCLPETLKHLYLNTSYSYWVDFNYLLMHLPPQLQSIYFHHVDHGDASSRGTTSKVYLGSTKNRSGGSPHQCEYSSDAHLASFDQTPSKRCGPPLESGSICNCISSPSNTMDSMSSMSVESKHLHSILSSSSDRSFPPISCSALEALPPTLTELSSDLPFPTDFWRFIPPTIQTIHVPAASQIDLKGSYFGAPIWQGCATQRLY